MNVRHKRVVLGDIANISSGGTPSRSNPAYWNGNIPWVKTTQIQNCIINKTDVDEWITDEGLKKSSAKMISAGTILMAMYGQGKTRGQVSILNFDASINQACAAIDLKNGICRDFVYQSLLASYTRIRNMSNTGGQENLSAGLIKEIPITLPPIPEQQAIADLLSTWDEAIEKTEQLIQAKEMRFKWLLRELISEPRKTQKDAKWIKVKIGSFLTESRNPDRENDPKKRLSVRLHLKGVEVRDYRGTESDGATVYFVRKAGQFIYGKQNVFRGSVGIVPLELDGYSSTQDIPAFDVASNVDKNWLLFLFSYPNFYKRLELYASGSGSKRLHPKELFKMKVALPSFEEQQEISETLSSAQQEIDLLKQLADKYKTQKRGLMQRLLTGDWRIKPDVVKTFEK